MSLSSMIVVVALLGVAQEKEAALALVEEGRAIQRERGEDGAEDAIARYKAALAKDPACGAAYWELGWSYQVLSRWDDAVAAWDKLKAIDPRYPDLEKSYPQVVAKSDQARALESLPAAGKLPPVDERPAEGERITLRAVGDVQMGRAWPPERATLPPNEGKDMFEAVAAILGAADVTFGNLETALADTGESPKCGSRITNTCYAFRVPTSYATALKAVGFDVMSNANNHAGDFGDAGRRDTLEALDKAGLLHSGPVGDVARFEIKGRRFALIGFATGAGSPRVSELEIARRLVADAARKADIVIVSFHGGAEGVKMQHVPKEVEKFYGENRGDVYRFAHTVIDAGADLVLGHGPHVWRGVEIYKGRFIAYSMGNFASWEGFSLVGPLSISAVLEVTIAPNGVAMAAKLHPVILEKPGLPKPDPSAQIVPIVRDLTKEDFGAEVFDESGQWARPEAPPRKKKS